MLSAEDTLKTIRAGFEDQTLSVPEGPPPENMCTRLCSQNDSLQSFYNAWEIAENYARHLNTRLGLDIVPIERTIPNPEWMATASTPIGEDIVRLCKIIGLASTKGYFLRQDINNEAVYIRYVSEALVTTAITGTLYDSRPQLYVNPTEIAQWKRTYPDIDISLISYTILRHLTSKATIRSALGRLAEMPPEIRRHELNHFRKRSTLTNDHS